MILASCATLSALIASAQGGETFRLEGACGSIEIARDFPSAVTIEAPSASVRGLVLSGSNIVWRGGTIAAPAGMAGTAGEGYAVHIIGRRIAVEGALITDARMGMVIAGAAEIAIRGNRFWRLRSDGINVSRTEGLVVSGNSFTEMRPGPGDHPDAVQLRDGVRDAMIEYNWVRGDTQGIAQMDKKGDAPLERIVVRRNSVQVEQYHAVTLSECRECRIEDNAVRRGRPDRKAVIRAGEAARCGNAAEDEKRDRRC